MSDVAQRVKDRLTAETLVVELVTEELPPKALKALGAAFADTLATELKRRDLSTERSAVTPFATPRRLAVAISHVAGIAPDRTTVRPGNFLKTPSAIRLASCDWKVIDCET